VRPLWLLRVEGASDSQGESPEGVGAQPRVKYRRWPRPFVGNMAVKNLRQVVTIRASPHAVYTTLVDPKEHAKFSGAAAKMVARPGGAFSLYDASLVGVVVHLEKDRRIVLAWRSTGWPEGHYSIAEFLLTKAAGGTRVEFSQYGIPASDFADISDGWRHYYWAPLKTYLEAPR
jgi:activator of HSP90 ATPase